MGLQIGEIVPRKAIEFLELKGKTIAIDAFNVIYQFISTIRQPDGTPLMTSKGEITSHLSGLFYRNINLLADGIKLVYVFDGKPPALKFRTNLIRGEKKNIAREKYEQAVIEEDIEAMNKYSKQMPYLNEKMIEQSKELLEAMGIAVIQAPSEGEAQASWLAKHKLVYAVGSQDYDSLLFGATRLIQNLTLARKRKTLSGFVYISPEVIELEEVLNKLGINRDQLICLGILVGTDYNPGGIKGIGQKKALEIVRKFRNPVDIFNSVRDKIDELDSDKKFDWKEIFELFHNPEVLKLDEINFPKFDEDKIKKILLKEEFSEERIDSQLDKLNEGREKNKQRTLF